MQQSKTPGNQSDDAEDATNRAAALVRFGDTDAVKIITLDRPSLKADQVLVRVEAAGVNAFDRKLRQGDLADDIEVRFPHVLGLELAGVVVEVGVDVTSFHVGERVMGELRQSGGAYAQFVAVCEKNLCATPNDLSALQAAAIPAAALTAWGALWAASGLASGMKVLVHGASGNVGSFAVQFAVSAGAEVYGTASAENADAVRALGATKVFDHDQNPADSLFDVNLVIDAVGNDSVDRLWDVLAPDGALVSVANPKIKETAPRGKDARWYNMVFDGTRLRTIALDIAAGSVKSRIGKVVTFDDLPAAIELVGSGKAPGKVVVAIP